VGRTVDWVGKREVPYRLARSLVAMRKKLSAVSFAKYN
jgi:hypothetical protein